MCFSSSSGRSGRAGRRDQQGAPPGGRRESGMNSTPGREDIRQQKGNAMNESSIKTGLGAGMNRRYFLQVTGAGLVTATALGASGYLSRAQAAVYEKFT